jgi:UDP-N-acetylglucosamine acyltransferase
MNKIHSTAVIDDRVILGENNEIGPYTVILGPTVIGDENIIGPNVVIGGPGQDTRNPRYDSKNSLIEIGDRNIIREFTAVQKPCYQDITKIGSDVYLMQSVHIPHDAIIEDKVVITPMCVLAGITRILEGANIGMGATINQYSVIGQYSMIAMGSAVTKNIKPFSIFVPNKPIRPNLYAIDKFGFTDYTDEIINYVVEGKMPLTDKIYSIIENFEKLHVESKRNLYK